MAKTQKPNEEDKIVKETIEKRFKNMFNGENQPLSNMSIQEVEALKSRVTELEAELAQRQTAPGESTAMAGPGKLSGPASAAGISTLTALPTEEPHAAEESQPRHLLSNLLRAPKFGDPAKDRIVSLQHTILIGMFLAGVLGISVSLIFRSDNPWSGLTILLLELILSALAFFWQRGGQVRWASWVIISTLYLVFVLGLFLTGFTFPTALLLALFMSMVGLLFQFYTVVGVTIFSIATLWALAYVVPSALIEPNELAYTSVILGLMGLLLTIASRAFERAFNEAHRSSEALLHTNRELHQLTTNLEARVTQRTYELQLAGEVGRAITKKVTQLDEMLTDAVEIIGSRYNLYYTQIYLTDPAQEKLILRAGTGEAGKELLQQGHQLMINAGSLNGRAAIEKRVQIVADTEKNQNFLPNLLLPNTRSEMSIPLIVDEKVVGVLDMQSEQPGALSESNLPAFEALAGQIAVAIRNAALFAEAQEVVTEVEMQMSRFTDQRWDDFLNAIHQAERIGFAFEDSQVTRLKPEILIKGSREDRLNLPLAVAGTKVGEIQVPTDLKPNELELVQAVGDQLAQHVENLRLLAQAETFRKEAELAVRRLTHEGWETYLNTTQSDIGYVYDLNQVQPLSEKSSGDIAEALMQPLVIREETIGELKVDLPEVSDEDMKIISAVTQQLSSHLETLRLSALNEKHAQREQTLRHLTSALRSSTNPTTIVRTAVREVGKILGRKTIVQVVSHEQASQAESNQGHVNKTDSPADRS